MNEGEAVDASNQLDDVLALPDHLGDALWRVESAKIEAFDAPGGLVVCGMGGSAVGGDLAAAVLGSRLSRPLTTQRGYELPNSMLPDRAVLCSSYSGDTEETIACYEAAEALGAGRIVATTGGELARAARRDSVPVIGLPSGLQPRAAVGYLFTAAAEVAALLGAAPGIRTEIDSSAAHLRDASGTLAELAAELAERLDGSIPIIYGADLTVAVAYRWKTQINENAKLPAFSAELPEADHNEIVGWQGARAAGRFAAIFLGDRDQHPRVRQRLDLTADLVEPDAAAVARVETEGESRTERLLWAVMLGDLLSLRLAARRGVDPAPIEPIERLKDRLGAP
ncbi:MAG: bifunctional phosphoglucose/phosphomannose isomerase [Solirubrobacterales bacterium]